MRRPNRLPVLEDEGVVAPRVLGAHEHSIRSVRTQLPSQRKRVKHVSRSCAPGDNLMRGGIVVSQAFVVVAVVQHTSSGDGGHGGAGLHAETRPCMLGSGRGKIGEGREHALERDDQAAFEHCNVHNAVDRGRRHANLRFVGVGAERADAHAADARELEQHVIAKAIGHFVVERHAHEGRDGHEGADDKAVGVIVKLSLQLRIV